MNVFSRLLAVIFAAILGAATVIVFVHFTSWGRETGPSIAVETTPVNRSASPVTSYAPVIKKAAPSVVNIYSTRTVRVRPMQNPFEGNPFFQQFQQFFGDNSDQGDDRPRLRRSESLGSGVIISPDGYILTANHVVAGADEIKVAIDDGKKEYTAKIVGTDPPTDVAVLKIDAKDLHAITLGDSDQLEVGDVLLAIGNPFGLGQTVTMGIVSATGRGGLGINAYEDFIQTDAAINPGNSGGALVDAEGRLVGINTAIAGNSGGNEGIGFAVPIDMVRSVMERLISGGKVTRGYLGVFPQDVTPGLAEEFKLPDENGALVGNVMPNTPADKAGIKAGDVIIELNGKKIADANDLRLFVSELIPETKVAVKFIRNGSQKTATVTLAELPQSMAQNDNNDENSSENKNPTTIDALDGVTVTDLNRHIRRDLGVPDDIQGALVAEVDSDSNADDAGLQRGDIIVEINRQAVRNADDAVDFCRNAKGDQILLQVWRRDDNLAGTLYISVDNKK
jgi:serine protease Do